MKKEFYGIMTQFCALLTLIEGMGAVEWTEETPIGLSIIMKGLCAQMSNLYEAMPEEENRASKPQRKRRGAGHEEK